MPRPANQNSPDPLDRPLPASLEAERGVLASILIDNSLCHQAVELLKPEDFFRDSHRRIYEKMLRLNEDRQPIDMVTLPAALQRSGELEQIGGVAYLSSLLDGMGHSMNIESYAKMIKERAMMRRLITVCRESIEACFDQSEDPETIIDQVEKAVFELGQDRVRTGFIPVSEIAGPQLKRLEDAAERPEILTGLQTGFTDLDRLTNGLQPSDLIIVAARPSMGKTSFCLNIAENVAINYGKSVGVFSLEMSKESLVQRLLCSQARVDSQRMRSGFCSKDEWTLLGGALQVLAQARIFIDDTPGISVMEMRAKSRRLKSQHGLDLLIVDYLQLIRGRGRVENRQAEVSQISRELKGLAKELSIPLIALSQLSRASETRSDHKPQLSDLRESGCLAGDSLVTLADSGRQVPIRELVGQSGFAVWALNEETMKIERAVASRAFSTGVKPVIRLTTRLGRSICATANHKFRAFDGWKRLDELKIGERLAMPRFVPSSTVQTMSDAELALLGHLIGDGCTLPRHAVQYTTREPELAEIVASLARQVFGDEVEPRIKQERTWHQVYLSSTRRHTHNVRSAVSEWLDELGAFGLRSHEKRIPDKVFEQPREAVALFLRHLWTTDGCIHGDGKKHYPGVYYASSSQELALGVQSLLLKLGINARLKRIPQPGKGRDQFHVIVSGKPDLMIFIAAIGTIGSYRLQSLEAVKGYIERVSSKTNRDVVPRDVWAVLSSEVNHRLFLDRDFQAAYRSRQNLSRERAARFAEAIGSFELAKLADSDVYWDEITGIELLDNLEVFDLTVDEFHNFISNNSFTHNSIEQDADVVGFIFREEMYEKNEENDGMAELIIAKQRNGPTGTVQMAFLKEFTRFDNMWRDR